MSSIMTEGLSVVYVGEQSSNDDKIVQIHHGGQKQVVFFSPELLLTDETCAANVSLQGELCWFYCCMIRRIV